MRDKLAGYLYRALSTDPAPFLALRIRHADGVAWKIADEVLTLTLESGQYLGTIYLSRATIGDLIPRIEALGCTIEYSNPAYFSFGAEKLIEGSGRPSDSNGDHIYAFDALLWSLIAAYAKESRDLTILTTEAIKQTHLDTAEYTWLDKWGAALGVTRKSGQPDSRYLQWMVREVTRPRSHPKALESAIFETTGLNVAIDEPWKEMFLLDESALSGGDKLQDGNIYTYNTLRPVSAVPIDWAVPLSVINRDRPAGTIVLAPMFEMGTQSVVHAAASALLGIESTRSSRITSDCTGVLDDNLVLSDAQPYVKNYAIFDGIFRWNSIGGEWNALSWDMATIEPAAPEFYSGNLDSSELLDETMALSN